MIFTCIGFNFIRTSKEKQKVILFKYSLFFKEYRAVIVLMFVNVSDLIYKKFKEI